LFSACVLPVPAACGVTQKRYVSARHEVGMSFACADGGGPAETEVRALMKVLIGVGHAAF
jgi:hypothetical protein